MAELQLASGDLHEAEQTYAQLVSCTPPQVSDRTNRTMERSLGWLAGCRLAKSTPQAAACSVAAAQSSAVAHLDAAAPTACPPLHPVPASPGTACPLLQLRLALNGGTLDKQREYFWRLAETCDRLGNMEEAEEHLKSLMDMDLTPEQKLEALCFLADVQVSPQEGGEGVPNPLAARLLPLRACHCMQLGAMFIGRRWAGSGT